MKQRIIQISLLVLTAAIIISFVPRSGDAQEAMKVKVEWGSNINIPAAADVEKLEAYRLVNNAVAEDEFVGLSNNVLERSVTQRKIKLDRSNIERVDEESLAWKDDADPSSFIMQNTINGHLIFSNQMDKFVALKQVKLPTKTEGLTLAKTFIKELKIAPADFESKGELLQTSGLYTQELDKNGALVGQETQKLMTLTFGRKMNGLQVDGGGSRMVVNLGDEGKVVGLERRWNAIQEKPLLMKPGATELKKFQGIERKQTGMIAPIKIRDVEKQKVEMGEVARPNLVLKKYITGEEVQAKIIQMLQDDWSTPDLIKVNSIELVYFDRGGDWMQPAYAFQADVMWGDEVAHYLFHLAALRTPPESIIPNTFTEQPHVMEISDQVETAVED